MVKCIFCGKDESFHKGLHLLKNDGSVEYYCSNKCKKNALKLGRDRRKVRWTEAYKIKVAEELERARKESEKKAAKKTEEKKEEKAEEKK